MFVNFQERILAIPVLIVCGVTLLICVMPQDSRRNLASVTNGRSLVAVHARLRTEWTEYKYSDREGMEVIACYADCQFGTLYGGIGNMGGTALREWFFYDKDDRFLFSLTEIGNRNLVRIGLGGKETLYQYRHSEK